MGTIRLGRRTESRAPKVNEFVPLAGLNDLVFTGWDIFEDDMYAAASNAGVLERALLDQVKPFLSSIQPRKAVFDHNYVKRLDGPNVKKGKNKMDLVEQVRQDIRDFKKSSGASRLVMIWCGSTETFIEQGPAHQSVKAFEKALTQNDESIAPSMIYAYASLNEGVPFGNGAPNLTVDVPAMHELSRRNEAPICGKDFKTGQTLIKTILRPDSKRGCWDSAAGIRRTFWAIATARCWTTRGLSRPKKSRNLACWNTFCSQDFIPSCTAIFFTRSALTIIRHAVITKKGGTISISLDGSAIPCRSKWIFSAVIRFWRHPLSWIWFCSSTWHSGLLN